MSQHPPVVILGIESSCDETAAAVLVNGRVYSNVIAGQDVHRAWGGVVPELASRAHQEHIVPVVHEALQKAGIQKDELSAVAFTQGPGLIGALLVGTCFARSLAQGLRKPLIAVDHLKAHALAHFIQDGEVPRPVPTFPFLNLTVSGGHTMIVLVRSPLDLQVLGTTVDDAAGEAFDKGAKMLGLPYPGGPLVDMHARNGDAHKYTLPLPQVEGLDMSFSGVKTAFRNIVQKGASDPLFLERERDHLCASLQRGIVDILLRKLQKAGRTSGVPRIAISGGVSANSLLREQVQALATREEWECYIPPFDYCTDNAAMIAMSGHFLYLKGAFVGLDTVPAPRW